MYFSFSEKGKKSGGVYTLIKASLVTTNDTLLKYILLFNLTALIITKIKKIFFYKIEYNLFLHLF